MYQNPFTKAAIPAPPKPNQIPASPFIQQSNGEEESKLSYGPVTFVNPFLNRSTTTYSPFVTNPFGDREYKPHDNEQWAPNPEIKSIYG